MDLEADVLIGDFRIIKRLGAGGMGIVYLARQVSQDRLVALKVLGPALNSEAAKARFQREAQAVARLDFPGIAHVHFVGQDRQLCFIAMDYIDGNSLRDVIARLAMADESTVNLDCLFDSNPAESKTTEEVRFDLPTEAFTPAESLDHPNVALESLTRGARHLMASPAFVRRCCEIVRFAALALAHAHERGVVHRDIKPENILIDRQGRVHLIDFGLARFFEDQSLTNTGVLVGTPMYMSPEQVSGRLKVDHRTDIYSLGLVLYEFLSLRRPIVAPSREGVLRQVVTKALLPVSKLNRMVPRDLESVVHRATSKDPDERYESAADFAEDLQNWIDAKPVDATPYRYSFDEREIVAERPKPLVIIATACFALGMLVFGFSVSLVFDFLARSRSLVESYSIPLSVLLLMPIVGLATMVASGGLLNGRKWAVPVLLPLSLGYMYLWWLNIFGALSVFQPMMRFGANGLLLNLVVFVINLSVFLGGFALSFMLVRKDTRDWFRLASRLRSEHRDRITSG